MAPRRSQRIPRNPDGSLRFTSGSTPTSVGERGNTGPTTRSQQQAAQESRNQVGRIMNSPAGYPSRRNPSGRRRSTAGGSPTPSSGGSSPAAQAVTGASGGGTTGGMSTGSSTTGTSRASIPSGPTPPKTGTAKPKKGTVLAKALGSQKGLKKGDEGTFAGYGKRDRNMALSFVKKNYKWARKDGNEQRARDVAGYLLGKGGGPFKQDGATGKTKLTAIGAKAKGQSRKPPKGVSDKEFKREIARYKATHKAARDPEKAKNVEAIVATILRGRKKKTTSTTKPNPVDGSKTPPPSPGGGPDLPPKKNPDRPGQPPRPTSGPDRPPTPKKKRPKPGNHPKRSHNGRVFDSQ